MTTDHQVTEDDETPSTERGLGVIVTGLIVLGTLATVAFLVTR